MLFEKVCILDEGDEGRRLRYEEKRKGDNIKKININVLYYNLLNLQEGAKRNNDVLIIYGRVFYEL